MKSQRQKRQERLVMAVAVGVIGLSVGTTLYFSDFLLTKFSGEEGGYRNVTFTDAVLSCDKHTRGALDGPLTQLTLDDHSSRTDFKSNRFLIFFRATMLDGANSSEYYVNCYVSGESGRITYFEGLEQKSSPTEVLRRDDGGLFGWPHN